MATNKVTGLRLSPEAVKCLKMFSFCSGKSNSQIVEQLILEHFHYYDGEGVFKVVDKAEDLFK